MYNPKEECKLSPVKSQTPDNLRTNKRKGYSATSEKYLPFILLLITSQTWVEYNLALYKNIIGIPTSWIHLLTVNNLKI